MSEMIYNESHVAISQLLGRHYNNPLGEAAFPLLRRLVADKTPLSVLDVGCGRGQTAIWWAGQVNVHVDAFDPSEAMLAEAKQQTETAGLSGRISFSQADIAQFHSVRHYNLLIAHDVLCYSSNRLKDGLKLAELVSPGGILSVSDYFRDGDSSEVRNVLAAWGIAQPPSFHQHDETLMALGLSRLFHFDTTRYYREHWMVLRDRLATRRVEIERIVGREETTSFAGQIEAILNAVATGKFGHCWTILERK